MRHCPGNRILAVCGLLVTALTGASCAWLGGDQNSEQTVPTAAVSRKDIQVLVSTNGTIEPVAPARIFAPVSGFIRDLRVRAGEEVGQDQPLLRVRSDALLSSLAQTRSALLQARRQARQVVQGPPAEELDAVVASIREISLDLEHKREELKREETLLKADATTADAVRGLRQSIATLELKLKNQRQKKQDLQNRYSPQEKQWELDRVNQLQEQVRLLEEQLRQTTVKAPRPGRIYTLAVKEGSFVNQGELLLQIFEPGQVRLRAYVDEPDLGGIEKGQKVRIEWDGMPGREWRGSVVQPADTVNTLGTRSVGEVLCSIVDPGHSLIPNINVDVQIITASKTNALVVPRSSVFSSAGRPMVKVVVDGNINPREVSVGLSTAREVEILKGLKEGDRVLLNPLEEASS